MIAETLEAEFNAEEGVSLTGAKAGTSFDCIIFRTGVGAVEDTSISSILVAASVAPPAEMLYCSRGVTVTVALVLGSDVAFEANKQ